MVNRNDTNRYFHRIAEETITQFFMNGVNLSDLGLGLMAGAVGNTSNPKHASRAIKTESEIWHPVIDEIIRSAPELSDDEVADIVLQRLVGRSLKLFHPLYEASCGKYGCVAIQGNPNTNDNLEAVVERAVTYSQLGENIAVKVVSTEVGLKALEELTARGVNTIATKGFSVAQTIAVDAAYKRGLERTDKHPKCWAVYSAGIFDEYLTQFAERENIGASPEYIREAGLAVAREVYRISQERGFGCRVLVGGRDPHHFTGLVGGDLAVTISDYTVKELLANDPPVVSQIAEETPPKALAELEKKFPDFAPAYYPDGLTPGRFRDFGPCVKFQNDCLQGYARTLAEIQSRRAAIGAEHKEGSHQNNAMISNNKPHGRCR